MKYLLTEIPKTFMTLLSTGLLPTGLFQALGCRLAISITGGRPKDRGRFSVLNEFV